MQSVKLLAALVDTMFGRRCVFCGLQNVADMAICSGCYVDLPWRAHCLDASPAPFQQLIAPLSYAFPVDAAIKAFKFQRKLYYAPAFEELLTAAVLDAGLDVDAVVAVPLHWRRKARRGFNQAEELAAPLARSLRLPLIRKLSRRVATQYQSGLSPQQRRQNLRAVFAVRGRLDYQHVLIVDDIVTTGATLAALYSALRVSGVRRVSAAALARAD